VLYAIRRLWLGVLLIAATSAVLLVADWDRRAPAARATKRIAVLQHANTPVLDAGIQGLLDGLAERGYRSGGTVAIEQFNAQGDFRDRVRQLDMGLEDRLDNPIGSLSGGQRQALTLVMASWRKPELLLLDEHTAALDPKSADQVIRLSEEIVARDRLTTLMVTHSMQQAVNLGDRRVMMYRGTVLHDFRGAEKKRLRVPDLLARFEDVRRAEQLDEAAAEMLRRVYV
jgi:ABC-type uncharacterized transport system ATPase component